MSAVVVVGGGPAGSSAALRLARSGVDTLVLERKQFPRAKVCGGYLSPGAVASLRDLDVLDSVLPHAQPITAIELAGFGLGPLRLGLPADGGLSIAREALDAALLDGACAAGAKLLQGVFLSAGRTSDGLLVRYRNSAGMEDELRCRVLIGADGAWSAVARAFGLCGRHGGGGRWAVGGRLQAEPPSDVLQMFVGERGYYARNPMIGGEANSMLVLPAPARPEQADAIVECTTAGRFRFDAHRLSKRVAAGPLRYSPRRVAAERVILTGDAGGFLEPFTGQGMSIALALSGPAARTAEAIAAGAEPHAALAAYSAQHRRIVAPRRMLCHLVELLVRVPLLRARALRNVRRDPMPAGIFLAAVAGAQLPQTVLRPGLLARLVA